MKTRDEFDGVGGRYEIRDGKRVQVEAPTKDHPDGNKGPRDSDGKLLDAPAAKTEPAAQRPEPPAEAAVDGAAGADKISSKRKGV